MTREEIDVSVLGKVVERNGTRFKACNVADGSKMWAQGQCRVMYSQEVLKRALKAGRIVRVDRGLYELTAAGLAWCRAASVANTP